ncbi:NADP-dependent oxidoreductase [Catenuloplanes atrovinosus]|uniref:NADPH:quinone reductase-like Zn-dependent oxidoreductase n=1 Tax=Catenuloplanes atrovinosus TaxID=137266 RepID=A0AAE3YWR2_9ACTN|nr:NADP-dependent oxidoreductase [Catenuloplanes atrovinosus]MDR7280642.1 NADPH:quinone reductase-like Zn-dependent oxidoreductase [Catenuloplanes atrovinosus]
MRAVRYDRYGPPEVLRVADVPEPVAGPGQVLVDVHAAGVSGGEDAIREGRLRMVMREPLPRGIGNEFAGVVAGTGPGVTGYRPGDRVWGLTPWRTFGAVAERVVVPAARLAPAPAGLDLVEAAALPVAGTTVLTALADRVRLRAGDRLLVRGAAGAVGVVAVQFGRETGAHVTALAGANGLDLVRRLGADEALDYRTTSPADLGTFDVILDLVGTDVRAYRRLLTRRGRLVALVADPDHLVRSVLTGFLPRVVAFSNNPPAERIARLTELVERGAIRPVISAVLPMSEAAEAHRRVARGGVPGKIVLTTQASEPV